MTTIKGEARVTLIVPFEFEIDDEELKEWAEKPFSEATEEEVAQFMESRWESWERDAEWPANANSAFLNFEVYEFDIESIEKP